MNTDSGPEVLARSVIDACTDCDECRYLMQSECLLFDELYRLHDREAREGKPVSGSELRHLVNLCNYCGLCVCPDIRAAIIESRTRYIEREGLPLGMRLMTRIEVISKIAGLVPEAARAAVCNGSIGGMLKRLAGIHPDRRLPAVPKASFPEWAKREGLDRKPAVSSSPKVAYFTGCTGRRLFPEVPRSVVQLFRRFGVSVYYPQEHCCGMPAFVEGDRRQALKRVGSTVERLASLVDEGFSIVCSCPTCGYLLKTVIREQAYFSDAYQALAGGDDRNFVVPDNRNPSTSSSTRRMMRLPKNMYGKILKDDGYFASIDPIRRIRAGENTFDAGEYLLNHIRGNGEHPEFSELPGRLAYFVPCHQREQKIGRPYLELLRAVPRLEMDVIDGPFDCCGMGGNMGFKKDFHDASIRTAEPLMKKIEKGNFSAVATDCLSCRLQFTHLTVLPVFHPAEILLKSLSSCHH
ncbi:MAG: heterodisulfide reductase-related iron-sulfur binding cluster [Desulfobacterales bacterium]